jgi:hypothetical protein
MEGEHLDDGVGLCWMHGGSKKGMMLHAQRHLSSNAIEAMETLTGMYLDINFAAITNGRGFPLEMTSTLASYFGF